MPERPQNPYQPDTEKKGYDPPRNPPLPPSKTPTPQPPPPKK
jgi:hypothetical protein